ncbi:hypothetical protein DPMN_044144 [Dreissena polymorpha]|uniref:Uncharacterized protein n=1 Tax=Dreissena polymorpha TaxID=45954 RepID=A0A9D4D1R1_DREPO|nr:hypothetical protein DPMN_044144 [Dreissena polymorpha]
MVFEILAVGVKFSELIALKQAEAESAKIKQKYTQQEAAPLKQKAESEANFQVLSQQKAFEAAAAEIKVLQEHDVEGSDGSEILNGSIVLRYLIGLAPILAKLPANVQERWAAKANDYEKKHIVSFPPFTAFVEFIRDQATICKL